MPQTEQDFFKLLKAGIASTYNQYAGNDKKPADWTQSDINNFQDHLEEKVKDRVSEKWVYLHLKKDNEKLPRIDVLNILSRYAGFTGWNDFKNAHRIEDHPVIREEEKVKQEEEKAGTVNKGLKKTRPYFVPLVATACILPVVLILYLPGINHCKKIQVIFRDAYTREQIQFSQLELKTEEGKNNVSPENGFCLHEKDSINLSVKGAYYKEYAFSVTGSQVKDTLLISLYPDDYALMLHYFSLSSTKDWQKRREQLGGIIHEGAKIYQVHDSLKGLEILNREELIDRLTLPAQSLKEIRILDIEYKEDKIFRLRFKQDL